MKIAFYTLPKADRKRIIDRVGELTTNVNHWKGEHLQHKNQAEYALAMLTVEKNRLDVIRQTYSFD